MFFGQTRAKAKTTITSLTHIQKTALSGRFFVCVTYCCRNRLV